MDIEEPENVDFDITSDTPVIPSPTALSVVWGLKAQVGKSTNLDVHRVLLHMWWLGWKMLCLFIYRYISIGSALFKYA